MESGGKFVLRHIRLLLQPRDDDQLRPRHPVGLRQLVGIAVYVARDVKQWDQKIVLDEIGWYSG